MRKFSIPAIFLGGGATTGLGAIRSQGRAGVDVCYIDDEKNEAISSKYCKKYFILPETSQNKNELKKILLKLQASIARAYGIREHLA